MRRATRLLAVCLILCPGLALLPGCGLPGDGAEEDRSITVLMRTTAGLFVGNDVGVLGVPVGEVTDIEPKGDAVAVTLRITDPHVRIPADAGAAIVARSVAVDRYLELTPVYSSGPEMADGATIPVERTASPVEFDEVLEALKTFSDDLANTESRDHSLSDLLEAADDTVAGEGKNLNRTLGSLADAVSEVRRQSPTIVGTLRSLTTLTTTLSDNESTVRRFVVDVADGAELLDRERRALGQALRTLSTALDQVGRIGRRHSAALRRDVRQLTRVLEATNRSRADLSEVVETLPLTSQNLVRATSTQQRVGVQLDPLQLLPLSPLFDTLCPSLADICDVIAVPPDLEALLDSLGLGALADALPRLDRAGRTARP